jgi:hypothetical protein
MRTRKTNSRIADNIKEDNILKLEKLQKMLNARQISDSDYEFWRKVYLGKKMPERETGYVRSKRSKRK